MTPTALDRPAALLLCRLPADVPDGPLSDAAAGLCEAACLQGAKRTAVLPWGAVLNVWAVGPMEVRLRAWPSAGGPRFGMALSRHKLSFPRYLLRRVRLEMFPRGLAG